MEPIFPLILILTNIARPSNIAQAPEKLPGPFLMRLPLSQVGSVVYLVREVLVLLAAMNVR